MGPMLGLCSTWLVDDDVCKATRWLRTGGGWKEKHTSWSFEVNDISIFLEHVDFLNPLNYLYIEFLEGSLELFVIGFE